MSACCYWIKRGLNREQVVDSNPVLVSAISWSKTWISENGLKKGLSPVLKAGYSGIIIFQGLGIFKINIFNSIFVWIH